MENFSPNSSLFDCPDCGAIKIGMVIQQTVEGPTLLAPESDDQPASYRVHHAHAHYIVRCNNCHKQAYVYARRMVFEPKNRVPSVVSNANVMNRRAKNQHEVVATWPMKNRFTITPHTPKLIREPFKQAASAQSVNAPLAAAGAIRKAVYELCNDQGVEGGDYSEKVRALPVDQSLKTTLLAVKDISDESLHADDWGYKLVEGALKAFSIVCNRIYSDKEELKAFVDEYSITKGKAAAVEQSEEVAG